MEIARSDIVMAVLPGDNGEGRPALGAPRRIQSDAHWNVVCPITSHLVESQLVSRVNWIKRDPPATSCRRCELERLLRQKLGFECTVPNYDHSRITFPVLPERIASKPCSKSCHENRCVITGRMSRPDSNITVILYQVSYISRP
jgi:hypothetical protein